MQQQGGSRIRAHPPGSFRLADPVAFSRAGMLPVGGLPFALETWVCFLGSLESPPATCSEQPLCQRGPRRLQQPRSQGCPQARLAHIRGLGPRRSSTCLPIPSTQVHSGVLTRNRGVTATELGGRRVQLPSAREERPPHSTPTGPAPPLWSTPWHQRPVRATHILLTQCPTVVALGRPRAAPKCLDSHVPALCVSP